MFMGPLTEFYDMTRAKLNSRKFRDRKRGVRGRLDRWYHLVKCLRWACQVIIPGGRKHFELASSFLVRLGRC